MDVINVVFTLRDGQPMAEAAQVSVHGETSILSFVAIDSVQR